MKGEAFIEQYSQPHPVPGTWMLCVEREPISYPSPNRNSFLFVSVPTCCDTQVEPHGLNMVVRLEPTPLRVSWECSL